MVDASKNSAEGQPRARAAPSRHCTSVPASEPSSCSSRPGSALYRKKICKEPIPSSHRQFPSPERPSKHGPRCSPSRRHPTSMAPRPELLILLSPRASWGQRETSGPGPPPHPSVQRADLSPQPSVEKLRRGSGAIEQERGGDQRGGQRASESHLTLQSLRRPHMAGTQVLGQGESQSTAHTTRGLQDARHLCLPAVPSLNRLACSPLSSHATQAAACSSTNTFFLLKLSYIHTLP